MHAWVKHTTIQFTHFALSPLYSFTGLEIDAFLRCLTKTAMNCALYRPILEEMLLSKKKHNLAHRSSVKVVL